MQRALRVNVEIFVRYEDSNARGDELIQVVDYNVMRDALLAAGEPTSPHFADRALDELLRATVVLASIEISDALTGLGVRETRARALAENTALVLPLKQADVRSPSALNGDMS